MKRLEDIDFRKTYGDVPESFQHRVQYALRRTEEEKPVKRKAMSSLVVILYAILAVAAAVAASIPGTTEWFRQFYGDAFGDKAAQGVSVPGGQSHSFGGVTVTLGDVVLTNMGENGNGYVLATAVIYPEAGKVLLCEEAMPDDLFGVDTLSGEALPAGTPSYQQKATESGSRLMRVICIPNGLATKDGALLGGTVGYTATPMQDGGVHVSMEIALDEELPEQAAYQISIYLATGEVNERGEMIQESMQAEDWMAAIARTESEGEQTRKAVRYANWYDTVAPLCGEGTEVTVADAATETQWRMRITAGKDHAEAVPVTDADKETMDACTKEYLLGLYPETETDLERDPDTVQPGEGWTPMAVVVTFPNGDCYLAGLAPYAHGEQRREYCIHFPRTHEQLEAISEDGYAWKQQEAIDAAWKQMQER